MISPGSRIGLLGGGQLARMTALAARRMGYAIHVFDPAGAAAPAAPVSDRMVGASFDDDEALEDFARGVDVVSLEFENIPTAALRTVARFRPMHPRPEALEICQHREREKTFLRQRGYPHADFRIVTNVGELQEAVATFGTPCVLKTAESGYDGKGQLKIMAGADLREAWNHWSGGQPRRGVVEAWVNFAAELSVICARNERGEMAAFPAIENIHTHHILDISIAPARFAPEVQAAASELAKSITQALDLQGLLAVEMFLTPDHQLLVNELAPRPHNSGHLTFDAGLTSQFEQHARAVCDLPLGEPGLLCPAVMVNLLGDLWANDGTPPSWEPVLAEPRAKLHLYGKREAKAGRKMGHFCVLDASADIALARARAIKAQLERASAL
jgi:5-(carboxyamino)imidazole ribonucleotide synthase